jgi:outer membrane protein assembly factor BamD
MDDFPDSDESAAYKINVIKSYYKYAQMSIPERQQERYEKVLEECSDFAERFPDSKLQPQVEEYRSLANNSLKNIQNEQIKATTQR